MGYGPDVTSPDVFAFDDYRAFLRHYYTTEKASGGLSLRAFSREVGLTSSNYLKLVMDGDRNLTPSLAEKFGRACGLSGASLRYFRELVDYGQAKTSSERERARRRLMAFHRFRTAFPLDAAHEAYHSEWYIPAIRELAGIPGFRRDPKWIASMLLPRITVRQAEQSLKVLCELGLLVEDQDGSLKQSHALLETPERPLGPQVANFHRTMMLRASEAIDLIPRDQREIASLTLSLSASQISALKKKLTRLRAELLRLGLTAHEGARVVQVNFQMFPLSAEEE